jgi:hypothetical protein
MQRLDNLPAISGEHMSLLYNTSSNLVLQYPESKAAILSAGPDVSLFSHSGCGKEECLPVRLTAIVQIVDTVPHGAHALLSNIVGGEWVTGFMHRSDGTSDGKTLMLRKLVSAAGQYAFGATSSWVRIVASPLEGRSVSGVLGKDGCTIDSSDHNCSCNVQLPRLFSPALYGVKQVPLLYLDVELARDTPAATVNAVKAAFLESLLQAATFGSAEVCIAPPQIASSVSRAGCEYETMSPPPSPQVPSPCAHAWTVQLYRGSCPTRLTQHGRALSAPSHAPDTSYTTPTIGWEKSCSDPNHGMPPGWQRDYCAVAEVYLCAIDGPQVIQFVVTATGNATLALNNTIVAISGSKDDTHASSSSTRMSLAPKNAVVLPQGCHQVSLIFQDPGSAHGSNQVCTW